MIKLSHSIFTHCMLWDSISMSSALSSSTFFGTSTCDNWKQFVLQKIRCSLPCLYSCNAKLSMRELRLDTNNQNLLCNSIWLFRSRCAFWGSSAARDGGQSAPFSLPVCTRFSNMPINSPHISTCCLACRALAVRSRIAKSAELALLAPVFAQRSVAASEVDQS